MSKKLTIRKAFKASCELREAVVDGNAIVSQVLPYNLDNRVGTLEEVIAALDAKINQDLRMNLNAVELAQEIRNRIQEANNKPLPYADNMTICQLIGKQATLRTLIAWYPAEDKMLELSKSGLELIADNQRDSNNLPNSYSRKTEINVRGIVPELREKLINDALELRVELESVTGQLAYANITETVDLTDEEVEVLRSFRIPV